jgi:hypothetical protein
VTDQEFEEFLRTSLDALWAKQDALESDYGFGNYSKWHFDQTTEKLVLFNENDVKTLEADVIDVGSYATNSQTWKWAWSNDSVLPSLREKAAVLKELATITGVELFASDAPFKVEGESMAWELAAMCVRHLGALGAYRAPSPSKPLATFLAIRSIQKWAH